MPNNEVASQKEAQVFEVITYTDLVAFNYTLPDKEEQQTIERELTIVWEDTVEKFIQEHGNEREYEVHTFKKLREQEHLINKIDDEAEDLIDEVQEEIANKMKFGFDFSGQLHNDD